MMTCSIFHEQIIEFVATFATKRHALPLFLSAYQNALFENIVEKDFFYQENSSQNLEVRGARIGRTVLSAHLVKVRQ